ncbi:putative ubiquitin carboxyl-terminal hydrolase 19 [Apostichopus japonicus]|uniref:ubiquitinyl hydrolase 1 n=1 Tax=Stichopus japonicus TaxID=307972 RepID=A0A2G8LF15_STIJA|nr:putative ubiquitin carboxyl-terminal hydrolase 19 [Apostichopus japonicus]
MISSDLYKCRWFTHIIQPLFTASVIGQPHVPERRQPLFFIKPCNTEGIGLKGPMGERLTDEGEKPLDLSDYSALAMDWRNDPKQANHVLVESKPLDFDDEMSGSRSNSEKTTTLEQCLQLFTETETLAPEEAWSTERPASSCRYGDCRPVLIIQLKRFSFKNFIWRDKIDKMVEFPMRGLDLSEFSQVKGQLPVYDLFGVINHHGGILGGHYTAFAKLISKENIAQNELGEFK